MELNLDSKGFEVLNLMELNKKETRMDKATVAIIVNGAKYTVRKPIAKGITDSLAPYAKTAETMADATEAAELKALLKQSDDELKERIIDLNKANMEIKRLNDLLIEPVKDDEEQVGYGITEDPDPTQENITPEDQ